MRVLISSVLRMVYCSSGTYLRHLRLLHLHDIQTDCPQSNLTDLCHRTCSFETETFKSIIKKNSKLNQGPRLTFQLSSQVASERFDFTSQNIFSLARLFLQNLLLCSICLIFSRVKNCKHASLTVIS